jgi:hypothetical protein
MLSSVLRSELAVRVNIGIMRTFVRLRAMLSSHERLARKLAALERKYDTKFKVVFEAIKQLMEPPIRPEKTGRIGFSLFYSASLAARPTTFVRISPAVARHWPAAVSRLRFPKAQRKPVWKGPGDPLASGKGGPEGLHREMAHISRRIVAIPPGGQSSQRLEEKKGPEWGLI